MLQCANERSRDDLRISWSLISTVCRTYIGTELRGVVFIIGLSILGNKGVCVNRPKTEADRRVAVVDLKAIRAICNPLGVDRSICHLSIHTS